MSYRAYTFSLKEKARAFVFAAFLLLMVGGPFYKQVLGGETILLRQWTMYTGLGMRVCDVSFYVEEENGQRMPVDRFQVLGYDSFRDAPLEVRRLEGAAEVMAVARRVQAELGDGKDLRVDARMATHVGWVPLFTGKAVEILESGLQAVDNGENQGQP